MKMQIERLFKIIYILLHEEKVSASVLAERLGVSRRTICRDVDTLSLTGIPIYTEKGKGGGISLLPEFVLNKSLLNEQEQSEILSALHGLSNIGKSDTREVLQKVSTIFNKNVTNWLEVDFSDWHSNDNYFNELKTAILDRYIAEFDYYNSYGNKTFRQVEPFQLWFKSKSWYLRGFCLAKQGERVYKLSRIKNLLVTDKQFEQRDLESKSESTMTATEIDEMTAIKFRIAPERAYRVYDDFSEAEVERQADGYFVVTTALPIDNWVHSFVLSYGKHIEILEPAWLRDVIKEEMSEMLKIYS